MERNHGEEEVEGKCRRRQVIICGTGQDPFAKYALLAIIHYVQW